MAVTDASKDTLEHIHHAAKSGNLAVLQTTRKSDGVQVDMLVSIYEHEGEYQLFPLGVLMTEAQIMEEYEPPTP